MSIVVTDDVQRSARVEAGLARNAAARHGARIRLAHSRNISHERALSAARVVLIIRLQVLECKVQCLNCKNAVVLQYSRAEMEKWASIASSLGFLPFASMLDAASSARRL